MRCWQAAAGVWSQARMNPPENAINVCRALYVAPPCKPSQSIKEDLLNLPWWSRRAARHEYFMSDTPRTYSYGNRGTGAEVYESQPFTPSVLRIMHHMNEALGVHMNVCFLNKYDDQFQHLGWHADEFPGMREDQPIIVMSYGAEREIWLKDKRGFPCPMGCAADDADRPGHRPEHDCPDCGSCGFVKTTDSGKQPANQRVLLEDGSMFIMPPGYQGTHLHRIPKHDRPCGWRISLTFRSFE